MVNLHIRISRSYADISGWIATEKYEQCIAYQHDADGQVKRTHVHLWMKGVKSSTDTLKNHVRKITGPVDKSDWYFTTVNKVNELWTDKLITYLSKGHLLPVFNKGFNPADVETYQALWVKPPSPVELIDGKLYLRREIKEEKKKKTKRELIEEMLKTYTDELDVRETVELVRKVLIDNNEVLGMYKVMDYYDSLIMYGSKDQFVCMVVRRIQSRDK